MYAVTPRSWFQRTIIPKPSPAEQCRTSKAATLALHLWYQSAASRIHTVSVVLWLAVDHVGRRFVVADGADGCPTRPVKARRFGNSARWWMSAIRSTSARPLISTARKSVLLEIAACPHRMTSSYRKTKKPTFGRHEHHVFADRCKQPVDDFRRGDGLPLAFNRSPRLRLTERILRKFQLGSRDKFGRKRKQSLRVTLAPLDLARETLVTAHDAGRVFCLCCEKGNVRRHTQLRKDAHVGSHCDGGFATLGRTERRARNAKLARKAQRCQSAGTAHRRQPLAELAQQFTGRRGIKFDRSRHAVQLFNRSTFNARDSAPLPGPSRSSGLVPSRRRWGLYDLH